MKHPVTNTRVWYLNGNSFDSAILIGVVPESMRKDDKVLVVVRSNRNVLRVSTVYSDPSYDSKIDLMNMDVPVVNPDHEVTIDLSSLSPGNEAP